MTTQAVSSAKRQQVALAPPVQEKWADKMPIVLLNLVFSYLNSRDTTAAVLTCRDWRPMRVSIVINALRKEMNALNTERGDLGQAPLSAWEFGEKIHKRWPHLKKLTLANAFDTASKGNLLPVIAYLKPDELAVEPAPDQSLIERLSENALTPSKLQLSAFHNNLSSNSVTTLELFFSATSVDSTNAPQLKRFPAMTSLKISSPLTALGPLLSNLPALRSLSLENARLSAYTRADFSKADLEIDLLLIKQPHTKLRELNFEATRINFDALFSYMPKMPALEWITFKTCILFQATTLPAAQAAASATGVRTLSLTAQNQTTPVDIQTLRKPAGWSINTQYSFGAISVSEAPLVPAGSIYVAGKLAMRKNKA